MKNSSRIVTLFLTFSLAQGPSLGSGIDHVSVDMPVHNFQHDVFADQAFAQSAFWQEYPFHVGPSSFWRRVIRRFEPAALKPSGPAPWYRSVRRYNFNLPQSDPDSIAELSKIAESTHFLLLSDINHRLVYHVLSFLPENVRAIQIERLRLLSAADFNGLNRWFKDIAWLAGQQRLKENPELLDAALAALPRDLAEKIHGPMKETELKSALSGETLTGVQRQVIEGKAILCYGHEVRYDPIQQVFYASEQPIQMWDRRRPIVSPHAPPKLVIGVLVHNGWDDTDHLLEQLSSIRLPNIEVALLDNGSETSGLARLAEKFSGAPFRLTTLQSSTNLGFDEGHNAIISRTLDAAMADHYLSLNPDVELDLKFLSKLLRVAEYGGAEPVDPSHIGSLAPLLYDERGELEYNGGVLPTLQSAYRDWLIGPYKDAKLSDYPGTFPVYCILGPAQWYPTRALRMAGGYDPSIFAYVDELPFGIRLTAAGFTNYVTQKTSLRHHGVSTLGSHLSEFLWRLDTRNRLYVMIKMRKYLPWESRLSILIHILRRVFDALAVAILQRKTEPRSQEPLRGMLKAFGDILFHRIETPQAAFLPNLHDTHPGWRLAPLRAQGPHTGMAATIHPSESQVDGPPWRSIGASLADADRIRQQITSGPLVKIGQGYHKVVHGTRHWVIPRLRTYAGGTAVGLTPTLTQFALHWIPLPYRERAVDFKTKYHLSIPWPSAREGVRHALRVLTAIGLTLLPKSRWEHFEAARLWQENDSRTLEGESLAARVLSQTGTITRRIRIPPTRVWLTRWPWLRTITAVDERVEEILLDKFRDLARARRWDEIANELDQFLSLQREIVRNGVVNMDVKLDNYGAIRGRQVLFDKGLVSRLTSSALAAINNPEALQQIDHLLMERPDIAARFRESWVLHVRAAA